MSASFRFGVTSVLTIAIVLIDPSPALAADPDPIPNYCAIEAIPDGIVPAVAPTPVCFVTRTELYDFLASPSPASHGSRHNLAADYTDAWWGGAELVWYHDLYDCYTHNFSNGTYPAGWNDVVSSAKTFSESGCQYFYHYEDVFFGGYFTHCDGAYCGQAIDNKTSSMKVQRNP